MFIGQPQVQAVPELQNFELTELQTGSAVQNLEIL